MTFWQHIKAYVDEWVRKWLIWRVLRQQGFAVFCKCGRLLNHDVPAEPVDAMYTWKCSECGTVIAFTLDAPVPLKVSPPHQEHVVREHCS